eukprot:jgi/Tetstr1/455898/TSEL_004082.t1
MGYKSKKRQSEKAAAMPVVMEEAGRVPAAAACRPGRRRRHQQRRLVCRPSCKNSSQRARVVEADILRRKRDKKVARLKAKIRLMFESNGSEAELAGSEGSGSDKEGGGQTPGRERPAGMSKKLRREATTRATLRKFIGRKAEHLEAWLTHPVGDDDTWQSVYAEGGPGAQFGAASGGDEGAEQHHQHGDVDAHEADGEEAGIVEEADLVGQRADVLAAHAPALS